MLLYGVMFTETDGKKNDDNGIPDLGQTYRYGFTTNLETAVDALTYGKFEKVSRIYNYAIIEKIPVNIDGSLSDAFRADTEVESRMIFMSSNHNSHVLKDSDYDYEILDDPKFRIITEPDNLARFKKSVFFSNPKDRIMWYNNKK